MSWLARPLDRRSPPEQRMAKALVAWKSGDRVEEPLS
jgi:hypothetical protein